MIDKSKLKERVSQLPESPLRATVLELLAELELHGGEGAKAWLLWTADGSHIEINTNVPTVEVLAGDSGWCCAELPGTFRAEQISAITMALAKACVARALATNASTEPASRGAAQGRITQDNGGGSSPADAGGLTPYNSIYGEKCYRGVEVDALLATKAAQPRQDWQTFVDKWMGEYGVVLKNEAYRVLVGASPAPSAKQEPHGWAKGYLSGIVLSDTYGHKVKLHFNTRDDAEAAFEAFIAMSESAATSASASPAAPPQVGSSDAENEVIVDRRDLFDFLRAAWREGSAFGWTETAESWHKATDHANAAIKGWSTLRAASPAAAVAAPVAPQGQSPADFKNFHRSLCARFGYTHDEQFWWRDLVSLGEHIAARVAAPVAGSQQVPTKERRAAWEYSFIHSSAIGNGNSEIGPCLTYDRAQAYGVGCMKQRQVSVSDVEPCDRSVAAQAAGSQQNPLAALHKELDRITWSGFDNGWNRAIAAVQKRIVGLLAVPSVEVARQQAPEGWKIEREGETIAISHASIGRAVTHRDACDPADVVLYHLAEQWLAAAAPAVPVPADQGEPMQATGVDKDGNLIWAAPSLQQGKEGAGDE